MNTAKVQSGGFEEGPGGPGFRYVFPLNFEGTHIGSAELGVSFEALRNSMEKLYAPEIFLFWLRNRILEEMFSRMWQRNTALSASVKIICMDLKRANPPLSQNFPSRTESPSLKLIIKLGSKPGP